MSAQPRPYGGRIAWGLLAPGWAVCVFLAPAIWAAGTPEPQEQLQHTRQNLRQEQSDLRALQEQLRQEKQQARSGRKQERSVLAQLQATERHIEEADDRYTENRHNFNLVQGNLSKLRALIAETEASLQEMRSLLAVRLRLLYREGSRGFWRVLVSAPTLSDALTRLKFFHALASQNAYWVERLSQTKLELSRQHEELTLKERQAHELEMESLRNLQAIQAQKKERERVLHRIHTERSAHEQAAQELQAASQRLNALIRTLERKADELARRAQETERKKHPTAQPPVTRPEPPPEWPGMHQPMPWPTRGRVTTRFGKMRHPRFNTYVYNKGIDITGPIGQNVIAVADGKVLFAQWFEGFGRMVILDHGYGMNTVYAHLAKITVNEGQTVAKNQSLGTLGDSGTWKGPSLYFEVRRRGEALDPMQWLGQ